MISNFTLHRSQIRRDAEKGQSLAEMAISLAFLVLLIAGTADIGRAFFVYMALHDAAQEGALYGSAYPEDVSGIEDRVRRASQTPIDLSDPSQVQVAVGWTGEPCEGSGNGISVSVTFDFEITTPFLGAVIGSQRIPLEASVVDTILRPPCSP